MAEQTFSIGDRVLVAGTDETGTVHRIEGDGADRRYWIDRGLTAQTIVPGQSLVIEQADDEGAFDATGPYTADELKPWY